MKLAYCLSCRTVQYDPPETDPPDGATPVLPEGQFWAECVVCMGKIPLIGGIMSNVMGAATAHAAVSINIDIAMNNMGCDTKSS